jgi:transposase
MARNTIWSNSELLTLGDLYRQGKSYNEIAVKLNRTKSQVAYALGRYRDVINVEYRQKGSGRKPMKVTESDKLVTETITIDVTPPQEASLLQRILSAFK